MLARTADVVDTALVRRLAPEQAVLADRLLPAASAAAEGSRLWLATAMGLALFGGRQGRRAAAQEVDAIAGTSVLVNGPFQAADSAASPGPRS